jgi:Ner family transcriptional regulator
MTTNIQQPVPATAAARRAWIKYQLELRGTTLGKLAASKGLSRTTVNKALAVPYPKMERVIALALGLTPQQLWPERYDETGERVTKRGRPRRTQDSQVCVGVAG